MVANDAEADGDTVARVAALLALEYSEHEVVVVTDGMQGHALAALEQAYALEVFRKPIGGAFRRGRCVRSTPTPRPSPAFASWTRSRRQSRRTQLRHQRVAVSPAGRGRAGCLN